jgi:nitrile hydratase
MNGVHDMGGMHGMGPVRREENEPVFHAPWEGRAFALGMALGDLETLDSSRHRTERIEGAEYLRMSYYERWLAALLDLLAERKLVTPEELATSERAPSSTKGTPSLSAGQVRAALARGYPASRDATVAPRFRSGQRVRARNMHPPTHTRLPRYVRGKIGVVERGHGVFVFPDTNAHALGEKPQHVYSVRFASRELWGENARPQDAVYLDLWDDYLDPA